MNDVDRKCSILQKISKMNERDFFPYKQDLKKILQGHEKNVKFIEMCCHIGFLHEDVDEPNTGNRGYNERYRRLRITNLGRMFLNGYLNQYTGGEGLKQLGEFTIALHIYQNREN